MKYIKPLFNIERNYYNGSQFYYELWYRSDVHFKLVVNACFFTLKDAKDYRDSLLD